MKTRLSIPSRILVAFASGALIAVFFLPAWRIDLFAPQYPEGLTMNIWINGLSGDIDIVNGLNHYIGMKHITVDMFPEFKFLPWVVGFYMLLGLLVAITGKRKYLFLYLILTVIGGAAAMIDFYKWGYNYGHNLDPTAPIQVPGLSYQPPLFGHKRILNFDSYSFPDVGGWIVIGAGILAFAVWFVEWYRHHKSEHRITSLSPALAAGVLCLFVLASSCKVNTEPINYGKDYCAHCKMGIMDPKFGGEIITKKGKIFKFDDLGCLGRFLKNGSVAEIDIAKKVAIDYEHGGTFVEMERAKFFHDEQLKSPMGSNVAALSPTSTLKVTGQSLSWTEILSTIK